MWRNRKKPPDCGARGCDLSRQGGGSFRHPGLVECHPPRHLPRGLFSMNCGQTLFGSDRIRTEGLDSCLTRFLHANRYPPTDQVRGHASLESATIPTGSNSMHRLLVLYNEPKDPAHFRKYYVETHVPLASKGRGVRAGNSSFDEKPGGPGKPPYFCVFEADFESEAAL